MDRTIYDSAARLSALGLIRAEKHARVKSLSDRVLDLGQRRQRTLARIARLEQEQVGRTTPEQTQAIAKLRAEVAALGDEKARVEEARDQAAEESQAAARCHESALAYAREHGLPLPVDERDETLAVSGTGQGGLDA